MGQFDQFNETTSDLTKELGEWALKAGRFFQSPQTSFVHLHGGESDSKAQTIPLLENTLFALALFRSRLVESVQEGKSLLKKILVFQNKENSEQKGNFPVYLHEYPHCQDPAQSILLLAPFYWILKQFGHVLGADLRESFEEAARLSLEHGLRTHQKKAFPLYLAVRLAAAQLAYGLLWNDGDRMAAGKEHLDQLSCMQLEGWSHTRHLADILVGLQMVYPCISTSRWSPLWSQIEQTWHPLLGSYIGPFVREWQEGLEPQVNLYDLFGGFFSERFSSRASLLSPHHLHGVLIQSSSDRFDLNRPRSVIEGTVKLQTWHTFYHPNWAYHLLEKKGPIQPSIDKTHTPLRFIWGDLQRLHSLVCQGGNIEKVEYLNEENSVVLLFDLKDLPKEESEEASKKEIEFFLDIEPEIQYDVKGYPATTFELGEPLQILVKGYRFSIIFQLLEGKGDFFGHIMLGNRPSQIDLKGEKRFRAYDWAIFLRTIRRQSHCRLQVKISFF